MSPQTRELHISFINRFHHIVRLGAEFPCSTAYLLDRDGLILAYHSAYTIDDSVESRESDEFAC